MGFSASLFRHTMPIPAPTHPRFEHDNKAVHNFVNTVLQSENMTDQSQVILMCGVALNDKDLMRYACEMDPTVVNRIIKKSTMELIDGVFGPTLGIKLGGVHH